MWQRSKPYRRGAVFAAVALNIAYNLNRQWQAWKVCRLAPQLRHSRHGVCIERTTPVRSRLEGCHPLMLAHSSNLYPNPHHHHLDQPLPTPCPPPRVCAAQSYVTLPDAFFLEADLEQNVLVERSSSNPLSILRAASGREVELHRLIKVSLEETLTAITQQCTTASPQALCKLLNPAS